MNLLQQEELRELVSHLTVLGSRVIWDGNCVRAIAMFGSSISDRDLSLLRQLPGLRQINLTRTEISDAGLFHLGKIEALEILLLGRTAVTDEGLELITSLANLKQLNLSVTEITDRSLPSIARMTQLECLWLDGADITDSGTESLAEMKSLQLLDLCRTTITDRGLANLRNLTRLEELNLSGCRHVTGVGLSELAGLSQLDWLGLDATSIDDAGLRHLINLPLQILSLNWTQMTREGLAHLREMKSLSELHILGTPVDSESVDGFRNARRDCVVHHSHGPIDGSITSSNI